MALMTASARTWTATRWRPPETSLNLSSKYLTNEPRQRPLHSRGMPAPSTWSRDALLVQLPGDRGDGEPGLIQLLDPLDRLLAHLTRPSELDTLRSLDRQCVLRPLADQPALHLSHRGDDRGRHLTCRRRGVDPEIQTHEPTREALEHACEVRNRPAQAIEAQDDDAVHLSALDGLERTCEPWPVRLRTGGDVLLHAHELPATCGTGGLDGSALSLEPEPALALLGSACSDVPDRLRGSILVIRLNPTWS